MGQDDVELWDAGALSLRFRRRPVHVGVATAVEAAEPVAGFAAGIGHRDERDRRIVEWAGGLVIQKFARPKNIVPVDRITNIKRVYFLIASDGLLDITGL